MATDKIYSTIVYGGCFGAAKVKNKSRNKPLLHDISFSLSLSLRLAW